MASRIEHTTGSAVATTGWGAVKGALGGALVAAAVGGLLVAAVIATAGAILPGITAASLFTGAAGTVSAWAIAGGAVMSFLGIGLPAAAAGGIIGGVSGANRVGNENRAAARSKAISEGLAGQQQSVIAEQAFAAGVQHGQQSVVQKLQAYHEQMVQQQMMEAAKTNPAGIGPASARIRQQQQAGQAAGATVA